MAHSTTLNGLAADLVTAITARTIDDASFNPLKEQTIRSLQDQSYARTNQFAVREKLDGLIEKFTVFNRDGLADCLQSRLDELSDQSKWIPEILSLLLELSDRPSEKTKLEDVENANQSSLPEQELTWEEILASDPLSDSEIWDDVERGYHSSGDDEAVVEVDPAPTVVTDATSADEHDPTALARLYLVMPDLKALDDVTATRDMWKTELQRGQTLRLSELAVVRQILTMLHGLDTDLFRKDDASGRVTVSRNVVLSTTSKTSLHDVLDASASTGRSLNQLRRWLAAKQTLAFLQSMQSSIQRLLSGFTQTIGKIEQCFINPQEDLVVSAVDVLTEVQNAAAPLTRISLLVQLSSMASGPGAHFSLIDYLYDEAGIAQMAGDDTLFEVLSTVFFSGLKTYLRHVGIWITTGCIPLKQNDTFFVKESTSVCPPNEFWHGRFKMHTKTDGTPLAPKCICLYARTAFTIGKARAFLRRLELPKAGANQPEDSSSFVSLDFARLRLRMQTETLLPFSQALCDALEHWLDETGVDCTPVLRSRLFDSYGLTDVLKAIPYVYFSKDSSLFSAFAETIVARISKFGDTKAWSNLFLLTELAQTTIGSSVAVNAESIHIEIGTNQCRAVAASIIRKLGAVEINYSITWPIQNITGSQSPQSHARVFAFLLQVFHAASLLQSRFLDLRFNQPASAAALKLHQRLLNFVNILQNYVTTTADEIHKTMYSSMKETTNIDGMVMAWAQYEKRLGTNLLLTPGLTTIHDSIIGLLELSEVLSKTSHPEGAAALKDQFDASMEFLVAGVRSVSRAGGEPALEMLAEKLAWGIRSQDALSS